MDQFVNKFNSYGNQVLEPFFQNKFIGSFILLVLVLYASYYAPRVPAASMWVFFNPWFRLGAIVLIAWLFSQNASISIMLMVAWYLTETYLIKNSINYAQQSGQVTNDFIRMVTGDPLLGLKTDAQISAEAQLISTEVQNKQAVGQFQNVPQAVLSSTGGATTVSNASIDTVPSGTPANSQSMMDTAHPMSKGPGGLLNSVEVTGSKSPAAYVPSDLMSTAVAPKM